MNLKKLSSKCFSWLLPSIIVVAGTVACGPKDSVVEEDAASNESTASDPRSRLTGGSTSPSNMNYCRYPLDLGTTLDPRRPGVVQTTLTSNIETRCAQARDARVVIRTRQKLTLVGRYACRSGVQSGEQICVIPTAEILAPQKTSITIPVTADDTLRSGDVEANVELY